MKIFPFKESFFFFWIRIRMRKILMHIEKNDIAVVIEKWIHNCINSKTKTKENYL